MKKRKIVVIFLGQNYCYMKNEKGKYSFPSFETGKNADVKKCIRNKFHINDSFHRDWIDIRFWKPCLSRSGETDVEFDCYVVDISKSLFLPKDLEYVDMKEIAHKKFSEDQTEIAELFHFVPSLELLDNDELLGQVYCEDEQIKVSLTNIKLLENEVRSIGERYFPLYFCEFTSDEDVYCSIKNELKEGEVYFYSVEVYDPHKHDDMSIEQYIDGRNDVVAALRGDMYFSSSPVLTAKGKQIVVSKNISKWVSDKYEDLLEKWRRIISNNSNVIRNNDDIVHDLNNAYMCKTPSKAKVQICNVGQANCCYCDLQYRKLFFDIGVTYLDNIPQSTVDYIGDLDADDIFVSHWDIDHILGIVHNERCLYGKKWIGPDIGIIYKDKPNLSLMRLTLYLITVGKSTLFFINTKEQKNKTRHISKELTLFWGEPKSATCRYTDAGGNAKKHTINAINNGGILLSIKLNNSILFTGDCDNNVIPLDAIKDEYDYVVVPHHGSIMNAPQIRAKAGKYTKAFICIGNITGNFCEDHDIDDKYINKQGFSEVLRTRDLGTQCYYEVILR